MEEHSNQIQSFSDLGIKQQRTVW